MAKEDMEEKRRHNRKIESVAVAERLYLKPYRKGHLCLAFLLSFIEDVESKPVYLNG